MKIKLPTSIVECFQDIFSLDLLFDEDDNYYESIVVVAVVVIEALSCEIWGSQCMFYARKVQSDNCLKTKPSSLTLYNYHCHHYYNEKNFQFQFKFQFLCYCY